MAVTFVLCKRIPIPMNPRNLFLIIFIFQLCIFNLMAQNLITKQVAYHCKKG